MIASTSRCLARFALFSALLIPLSVPAHAFPLQSPVLKSVKPVSPYRIDIDWRNNDAEARSIAVFRKSDKEAAYSRIAEVALPTESFADTTVDPGIWYRYAVMALADGASSDLSPADSAQTPSVPRVMDFPGFRIRYDKAKRAFTIEVTDKSNAEEGYRIYRTIDAGPRILWKELRSDRPIRMDKHVLLDTGASRNSWYTYSVEMLGASPPIRMDSSLFSFDAAHWVPHGFPLIQSGRLLGRAPAKFHRWAFLEGDNLALHEPGSDDSTFTLIDVKDRTRPLFKGFGKASRKICEGNACVASHNRLLMAAPEEPQWIHRLLACRFEAGRFLAEDSLDINLKGDPGFYQEPLSGDSTFLFEISGKNTGSRYYQLPVRISGGKLSRGPAFEDTVLGNLKSLSIRDGFILKNYEGRWPWGNEYVATLRDFRSGLESRYTSFDTLQEIPPRAISGMSCTDSTLLNADKVLLDSANRHAFVFRNGEVRIHEYGIETWSDPAIGIRRTDGGRGPAGDFRWVANPGNALIRFRYTAAEREPVELLLLDASGRRLAAPATGFIQAGPHEWTWERPIRGPVYILFRSGNHSAAGIIRP